MLEIGLVWLYSNICKKPVYLPHVLLPHVLQSPDKYTFFPQTLPSYRFVPSFVFVFETRSHAEEDDVKLM